MKNLSEYAARPLKQSVIVRIWVEKKAIALGRDVTQAIIESWGADYKDYGTIEGRLEAIEDHEALKIAYAMPCFGKSFLAMFRRISCRMHSQISANVSRFLG